VCYPGDVNQLAGFYTIDLAVNDTGFLLGGPDAGAPSIIETANDTSVTLTLTNIGTTPHGFAVGCTSVCSVYPNLPAGCAPRACFPANSTVAPLAPGASATITFTPLLAGGLTYPFTSNEPNDSTIPGLNDGQWIVM
jgi:hypothetical protein